MATKFITNNENYSRADSGCEVASHFLGHQSLCQECPFEECILIKSKTNKPGGGRPRNIKRDAEIAKRFNGGELVKNLMVIFSLSERRIRDILKRARE